MNEIQTVQLRLKNNNVARIYLKSVIGCRFDVKSFVFNSGMEVFISFGIIGRRRFFLPITPAKYQH
jgi:DNA polymerase III alpha subunit (gram-positive type)